MLDLKFAAFRPCCWRNSCFGWLWFMFNVEITLDTFETKHDQSYRLLNVTSQYSPIRLDFKIVIGSNKPQYRWAEIQSHTQREACVCRVQGSVKKEVRSQCCRECCTKSINAYANPSVKVIGCPRDSDIVINSFHRFHLEGLLSIIRPDRCCSKNKKREGVTICGQYVPRPAVEALMWAKTGDFALLKEG